MAALTFAPPATAQLTRSQQTCVNYLNARLRDLNRTVQRETERCIQDYDRGERFSGEDSPAVTDIPLCVAADRRGRIEKAIAAVRRQYDEQCVGVDQKGVPRLPALASDATTIIEAVNDDGEPVVDLVYGPQDVIGVELRAAEPNVAACRAEVSHGLHLCQDAILVEFQECVKMALKVNKEPVPEGATTVDQLGACFQYDPTGRVARKCDSFDEPDEIRAALAKRCPEGAIDLATAFPRCGETTHEGVHACLKPQAACSSCEKLREADGLTQNCDAFDDGLDNLSCGCGDGVLTPAEECDDGNDVDDDACSNVCTLPACGDGRLSVGEECDDGNVLDGDGCSALCAVEYCGDGIRNDGGAEECDVDDAAACGDGLCSTECTCAAAVFVTSSAQDGDLGGRAGANATCQGLAEAAGLGGTFHAWLSIYGENASSHMTPHAQPYALVDGTKIADDFDDLSDGSLDAPIRLDELGFPVVDTGTDRVWTHTEGNGEAAFGDPCNAWTSSAPTRFAVYGLATASTDAWTRSAFLNCDMPGRLYCIQQ